MATHQGTQRAAVEFARLDAGGDRPAMRCDVSSSCVIPFRSLPPHPGGTLQAAGGAPLAWLAPLLGWARRGERRHLVAFAGGALLLAVVASLAGRA